MTTEQPTATTTAAASLNDPDEIEAIAPPMRSQPDAAGKYSSTLLCATLLPFACATLSIARSSSAPCSTSDAVRKRRTSIHVSPCSC